MPSWRGRPEGGLAHEAGEVGRACPGPWNLPAASPTWVPHSHPRGVDLMVSGGRLPAWTSHESPGVTSHAVSGMTEKVAPPRPLLKMAAGVVLARCSARGPPWGHPSVDPRGTRRPCLCLQALTSGKWPCWNPESPSSLPGHCPPHQVPSWSGAVRTPSPAPRLSPGPQGTPCSWEQGPSGGPSRAWHRWGE